MAYTDSDNAQRVESGSPDQEERQEQRERQARSQDASDGRLWGPESAVGRVANGVPNRAHRLRGLGNAIVPQVAEMIFRAINEIESTDGEGQ